MEKKEEAYKQEMKIQRIFTTYTTKMYEYTNSYYNNNIRNTHVIADRK